MYIRSPIFPCAALQPSKAKGALRRIPAELAAGTEPLDAVEHSMESTAKRPVAGGGKGHMSLGG